MIMSERAALPIPSQRKRNQKRNRRLFLIALFAVIFLSVRVVVHPINDTDYVNTTDALHAFLAGQNPYSVVGHYMPPWSLFFLTPLVNQPVETWLALDVALFVTAVIDLGGPAGLLLMAHPAFITLIASANPEWLFVGTGLWLLYHEPRGWLRGVTWLLLTCKPQTTFFVLIVDGMRAVRERDWKAIGLAAIGAIGTLVLYPQFFERMTHLFQWSTSVLPNFGILGALIVTSAIVGMRWKRHVDLRTMGLLLAPVWSPYMLEYSYVGASFTLRGAVWWRIVLYVAGSIALAYLFWRDYHVHEWIGALGMVLLAALLAPADTSAKAKDIDKRSEM